jgi:hypothetical protein
MTATENGTRRLRLSVKEVPVADPAETRERDPLDRSTYISWMSMKGRCLNPRNSAYGRYGGRGIKVCARWMAYENFRSDMGLKPKRSLTLERRDTDGHYEPSNCEWASGQAQSNNRRNNHRITFQGKTHTLTEWSRILGIIETTLRDRLLRGWGVSKAFCRPVAHKGRRVING